MEERRGRIHAVKGLLRLSVEMHRRAEGWAGGWREQGLLGSSGNRGCGL